MWDPQYNIVFIGITKIRYQFSSGILCPYSALQLNLAIYLYNIYIYIFIFPSVILMSQLVSVMNSLTIEDNSISAHRKQSNYSARESIIMLGKHSKISAGSYLRVPVKMTLCIISIVPYLLCGVW